MGTSAFEFPLKTGDQNGKMVIMDSNGERVKLACVNWAGAHMEEMVVNGLDRRPVDEISQHIKDMGFNCVRLIYALDTVYLDIFAAPVRLTANENLVGMKIMEVFDVVVNSLTSKGSMVILNNHISTAGWCCSTTDGEGFWYTNEYPQEEFFEHWALMAERYRGNPLVIGADLRNEPRDFLIKRITWGSGNNKTDWNTAAEIAARKVLNANPEMLIFVEGIDYASHLEGVSKNPIRIDNQEKLVYSGHSYHYWSPPDTPYEMFATELNRSETFMVYSGQPFSAPFWLGETGTGDDNSNWKNIVKYLGDNDLDWAYWSLDGYQYTRGDQPPKGNGNFTEETYGLFNSDFHTIRHPWKLAQLQEIMPSRPSLAPTIIINK